MRKILYAQRTEKHDAVAFFMVPLSCGPGTVQPMLYITEQIDLLLQMTTIRIVITERALTTL